MNLLNTIVPVHVKTIVFDQRTWHDKNRSMTLASRITEARKKLNLTQDDLADAVGCSVDMIRKLEQGARKSTTLIVKLANALQVSPSWLDAGNIENDSESNILFSRSRARVEQPLSNYNVLPLEKSIKTVPLLSFVQAGDFIEAFEDLELTEQIVTDAPIKKHTYALRVSGDSMEPVFKEGMIVIVEPELSPIPGDFVIAKNGDNEATLKQLVKDGADWYLKPLNAQYPTKDASKYEVIGVVIQVQQVTKFR